MLQTAAATDLKSGTKSGSDSKSSHKPLEIMQYYLLNPTEEPRHLALLPGDRLVIVNADQSLCVRDLKTNTDTKHPAPKDKKTDAKTSASSTATAVVGQHLIVSFSSGLMHAWQINDAGLVPVKANQLKPMTSPQITAVGDSHMLVVDGGPMPPKAELDTRRRLFALSDILEKKEAEIFRIMPHLLPIPDTKTQAGAICTATATSPSYYIAGGMSDGTIQVWDIRPVKQENYDHTIAQFQLTSDGHITALAAASPTCIISGNAAGRIQVWNLLTRTCVATWQNSDPDNIHPILSILVNDLGTVIVRDKQSIKTWTGTGKSIAEFDISESRDAVVLPDARLAVLTRDYVCFCEVRNQPLIKTMVRDHEQMAKSIRRTFTITHESKDEVIKWALPLEHGSISIGCKQGFFDSTAKTAKGSIISWYLNPYKYESESRVLYKWENHKLEIQQAGVLENELVVASVIDEGMFGNSYSLKVLNVAQQKVLYSLNEDVRCMAILPYNRWVIGTMDNQVKIYSIDKGKKHPPQLLATFPQRIQAIHLLYNEVARKPKLNIITATGTLQIWEGIGWGWPADKPTPTLEMETPPLDTRLNLDPNNRKADFTHSCFIVGALFAIVNKLNPHEQIVRFWALKGNDTTKMGQLVQSIPMHNKTVCAVWGYRASVSYLLSLNADNQFELWSVDHEVTGPFCISSISSQHGAAFRLYEVSTVRAPTNILSLMQLDYEVLGSLAYSYLNYLCNSNFWPEDQASEAQPTAFNVREILQTVLVDPTAPLFDEKSDEKQVALDFARQGYPHEIMLEYLDIGGFFLPEPKTDAQATAATPASAAAMASPQLNNS